MALKELDNSNISVHLGKSSQYKSQYDPSLLVREPRQSNRTHLDIQDDNLPFGGMDVWNAYETSGLLHNGVPFTGVLKLIVPADSKYIVESKSYKLYLNSFNMTKLGTEIGDTQGAIYELESKVTQDLSKLLETRVSCKFLLNSRIKAKELAGFDFCGEDIFSFTDIDGWSDEIANCDTYKETPDLLDIISTNYQLGTYKFYSGVLKSNCRVTSQPDWGDVFITIKGQNVPTESSLLKYIVSFRDECHFHEEICETIYKRLWDLCKPTELKVKCLYARRGGIDINPIRVSHDHLLCNEYILDLNKPHIKTPKQ